MRECKKELELKLEINVKGATSFQRYVIETVVLPQIMEDVAETLAVSEFMLNHIEEIKEESEGVSNERFL